MADALDMFTQNIMSGAVGGNYGGGGGELSIFQDISDAFKDERFVKKVMSTIVIFATLVKLFEGIKAFGPTVTPGALSQNITALPTQSVNLLKKMPSIITWKS